MGPLEGLRVLDISTMLAGPFAATLLGDMGAEVIKVEHPKMGDNARVFGPQRDGIGLYWKSIGRNKKCITLDMSKPRGQELLRQLAAGADAIIENFRPGTLEKWNLGYKQLKEVNPKLVMLRVTGFGYGGPYSQLPGFGTLVEAMSGFAHITGPEDGPPTLPPFALADGIAGIFGAMGLLAVLYHRDAKGGNGQWIDHPIYEPLMRIMEVMIVEYGQTGYIRGRVGNRVPDAAPRGAYETKEKGRWIALSGSSQATAMRVLRAIGRDDMADDPRFRDNQSRMKHVDLLDAAIAAWVGQHTVDEVLARFREADAPVAQVYDVADIYADPHFRERQTLIEVPDPDFGSITVQNVGPRFSDTPGEIKFTGRALGADNEEIYGQMLGLTTAQLEALRSDGVI